MANRAKPSFPQLNRSHPLAQGMIVNIPIFERSGTPSEILNRYTLSLGGTPSWIATAFGGGLNFTGASDKLNFTVPQIVGTAIMNKFSFSCWVYRATNDATTRRIIDANGSISQGFTIQTPNGDFNVGINHSTTAGNATASGVITAGAWTHLAFTWDANNNFPTLYVNGNVVSASTTNKSGTQSDWTGVVAQFANRNANDRIFNGVIDSIMMWNRVLSAQDFQQLYADIFQIYKKKSLLAELSAYVPVASSYNIMNTVGM